MKFKHKSDAKFWEKTPKGMNKEGVQKLHEYAELLDRASILSGMGEITITSYWRPKDALSWHSVCQAVDIRTKDKSKQFRWFIEEWGKLMKRADPRLHMYGHPELVDRPQEHIHISYKNGDIPC